MIASEIAFASKGYFILRWNNNIWRFFYVRLILSESLSTCDLRNLSQYSSYEIFFFNFHSYANFWSSNQKTSFFRKIMFVFLNCSVDYLKCWILICKITQIICEKHSLLKLLPSVWFWLKWIQFRGWLKEIWLKLHIG